MDPDNVSDLDAPSNREKSLTDEAFDRIEEMIVTRHLQPGTLCSESMLMAELSIGRSPIREALARLEWLGFVEIHPRRGVLVTNVDVIRHLELLEVRLPLECAIVSHAAERASEQDLEDLQSVSRALATAAAEKDRSRYFLAKRSLHEIQIRAAYNPVLVQTMRSLHAHSRRFWMTYEKSENFAEAARCHGTIVDSVKARDAERATDAVRALFLFLDHMTKQVLDRRRNF